MAQAKQGDVVRVHYTGKLKDGTVFDSSKEREPLQFTIGQGKIIPGFEKAVVGMNPGDSKTATVAPNEAYGTYQEDMVVTVEREKIPQHVNPEVGQQFQVRSNDGGTAVARVTEISDSSITLDANHPLAGKDLVFDIELMEIDAAVGGKEG